MTEGINDAVQGFLRFFSFDTFSGDKNVFSNFAQGLRELRGTVMNISMEVAKQVFDGGAEVFKGVRDEFVRLFGGNPSVDDAGKAASSMSGQSSGAKSAISGMPSMSDLMSTSSTPSSSSKGRKSVNKDPKNLAHERERLLKQMYNSQQ
jgi:hypothetical protein